MKSAFISIALLTAGADCRMLLQPDGQYQAAVTVAIGPEGICPAVPTIVVEVLPVYYNQYIQSNTVIEPFGNGQRVTVSDAPTEVRITSTLTTTRHSGSWIASSRSTSAIGFDSSSHVANFQPLSSISIQNPPPSAASSASTSSTEITGNPPSATNLSTSTHRSFVTSRMPSSSGSIISSSSSASIDSTPTHLRIGQGLAAGTVNDLPDSQFIMLAFASAPGPTTLVKRRRNARRQSSMTAVRPIIALNLDQSSGLSGDLSQYSCDASTPLLLRSGTLVQYQNVVGKLFGEREPLLGFLNNDHANTIHTTFSFVDGFLRWDTPDQGPASFYNCAGTLFATFGAPPNNATCVPVIVGAIAGEACLDRVRATRSPDPAFTAPITSSLNTINSGSTTVGSETSLRTINSGSTNFGRGSTTEGSSSPSTSSLVYSSATFSPNALNTGSRATEVFSPYSIRLSSLSPGHDSTLVSSSGPSGTSPSIGELSSAATATSHTSSGFHSTQTLDGTIIALQSSPPSSSHTSARSSSTESSSTYSLSMITTSSTTTTCSTATSSSSSTTATESLTPFCPVAGRILQDRSPAEGSEGEGSGGGFFTNFTPESCQDAPGVALGVAFTDHEGPFNPPTVN